MPQALDGLDYLSHISNGKPKLVAKKLNQHSDTHNRKKKYERHHAGEKQNVPNLNFYIQMDGCWSLYQHALVNMNRSSVCQGGFPLVEKHICTHFILPKVHHKLTNVYAFTTQ